MEQKHLFANIQVLFSNIFWGLNAPISKLVLLGGVISPLALTNMRMLGSMILFWLLALVVPYQKVPLKDHVKLFFASICGVVLNQGLFIFGVSYTSPSDASIITTSMPLWAMLLSFLILKEKLTVFKIAGLLIGAIGALILILSSTQNANETAASGLLGDFMVLMAQFFYALYIVIFSSFIRKYSVFTIMRIMFSYATLIILPFAIFDLVKIDFSKISSQDILCIFYIVIIATFFAQLLMIMSQKHLTPTLIGIYNYIQPVSASVVAILWGLDSFSFIKVFSVILIFSGVFFVIYRPKAK